MISLTYTSRATEPLSAFDLFELLRDARERNAAQSITGLLVYAQQSFIQFLEGDDAEVDAVYARIASDPRHTGLQIVARERITNREYPAWSMGFAFPEPERLAALLPGYDPLGSLAQQTVVSPATAQLLLAALAAEAEAEGDPPPPESA